MQFAGDWFNDAGFPASELVGILAAIVVLLIAFGSLIAMGLPIVTALIGICGLDRRRRRDRDTSSRRPTSRRRSPR